MNTNHREVLVFEERMQQFWKNPKNKRSIVLKSIMIKALKTSKLLTIVLLKLNTRKIH
jgi:hypothetical protein